MTELSQRLDEKQAAPQVGAPTDTGEPGYRPSPVPDYTEGMHPPFEAAPGYPGSNVLSPYKFPIKAQFGPGFQFFTEDDRYRLDIHYESQIEARVWQQDQVPANSGLFFPRQRIFFDGHITKPLEYELSINRGVNNINILNAYLNFHVNDQFEIRFGRRFSRRTPTISTADLKLLAVDAGTVAVHDQPQPEPADRPDGVGVPVRQSRLDYAVGNLSTAGATRSRT